MNVVHYFQCLTEVNIYERIKSHSPCGVVKIKGMRAFRPHFINLFYIKTFS